MAVAARKVPKWVSATIWKFCVPATFWDDHAERVPTDNGEAGLLREGRRVGNLVEVSGNAAQVECLRSDAEFYCDRDGPDECPANIKRSAKRTLKVIDRIYLENPSLAEAVDILRRAR